MLVDIGKTMVGVPSVLLGTSLLTLVNQKDINLHFIRSAF